MRGKQLLPVLLISGLCGRLAAAEPEQLHVFGVALPDAAELNRERYSGSYQRIDAATLARQEMSLAEIIAHEPGVEFRQAGGVGSYANISMRAASAAQTGVYLDGVKLNDAGIGGVNLAEIELLNVGAVEFFRGSTPLLLGGANLGGAVNLRSPQVSGQQLSGLVGGGSWDSRRYQLLGQTAGENRDFLLSVAHQSSANDFDFLNDNSTPFYSGDDRIEARRNSAFSRDSLLAKTAYYASDLLSYHALLQWSQREQGVADFHNSENNRASWDNSGGQLQLQRQRHADGAQQWSSIHSVYFNTRNETYDDRLGEVGLQRQHLRSDTRVSGLKSHWQQDAAGRRLAFSGELRQEVLDSRNLLQDSAYQAERLQVLLAAEHSRSFSGQPGVWSNTLRFESSADDYDGLERSAARPRTVEFLALQSGVRWQWRPQWRVQANLGNYQREPNFFELFGNRGVFTGNPELEAERGVNADLGLYWQADESAQNSASLLAFASHRDELISPVYNAQGIGRSENSGKNRVAGVELAARWALQPAWQWRANLTWQDSENRSRLRAYRGKQLPGVAELSAYSRLQYQRKRWRFWYELDSRSERFFDSANLLRAGSQTVHNAGLNYQRGAAKIILALHNLSDKNHEDFNGFPKPGRAVHLTVSFKLNSDSAL